MLKEKEIKKANVFQKDFLGNNLPISQPTLDLDYKYEGESNTNTTITRPTPLNK